MFNKIYKEIDDFTSTIKEPKGCDEMLSYMNSNVFASIKLLMFASKTFSLYGRIMLFFIISLTGLLFLSTLGSGGINLTLLSITLILFILILYFAIHFKIFLISSINKTKENMQE